MSTQSVYRYVDAMAFPRCAPASGTGHSSPGAPLFMRAAAGDLGADADRFEFAARPPFHPVKFLCFLYQGWPLEVRVEGEFWVDNAPDDRCEMLISGGRTWYRVAGRWQAASVPLRGGMPSAEVPADWDGVYGDRRQRLIILGAGAQAAAIERQLDGCLIRDGSEFLRRAARPHDLPAKEVKNAI